MTIEWITALMILSFMAILAAGLPLAFATGAVAVIFALALFGPSSLNLIVSRVFTLMGNYVLVSVPLFILMACILERAGVAEELFQAVHVWSGRLRGGLAVAVIISCAIMAAMVGVIGAEVVTMGVVALPAMLSRKYDKDLALGSICAGGGLATLIPPSVVFIMYGLTAGVSVGQLYMAGVVPGLLLAGLYIAYIITRSHLQPHLAPAASAEELGMPLGAKLRLLRGLILPGLVAGGVGVGQGGRVLPQHEGGAGPAPPGGRERPRGHPPRRTHRHRGPDPRRHRRLAALVHGAPDSQHLRRRAQLPFEARVGVGAGHGEGGRGDRPARPGVGGAELSELDPAGGPHQGNAISSLRFAFSTRYFHAPLAS